MASPTTGQETFGKSPYLSESQFPHLDDGGNDAFLGAQLVDELRRWSKAQSTKSGSGSPHKCWCPHPTLAGFMHSRAVLQGQDEEGRVSEPASNVRPAGRSWPGHALAVWSGTT